MAWEEPRKTGMQYRRLGNSGLHVSVLGLGGLRRSLGQYNLEQHANIASRFGGHVENGMIFPSLLFIFNDSMYRTYFLLHEASLRLRYQLLRYC
jgi:hypothetical protein